MSDAPEEELLTRLRAQKRTRPADAPADRPAPRFQDLPGYDQLRLMRAAGDTFGLRSPFFQAIEAVDGPRVRIAGKWCLNFASYDYLGLNQDPELRAAVQAAAGRWGVSPSASRLVGGERPFHADLEADLAAHYETEAAIAMVSGHATNVTAIRALMGKGDLVLVDALIHNSVAEGIRASGADHLTYPHNDTAWIDRRLTQVRDQYERVLIVAEGLYSMDGDMPDLAALVQVKRRHGAWLMLDEAHALGVLGAAGRGVAEAQGVAFGAVDIWMGTLSKTLAACGGYIAGSAALVEYLRYRAAGFVYSVGLSAPHAAAARTALAGITPERVAHLAKVGTTFRDRAEALALETGLSQGAAITPVILRDSMKAVRASNRLLERGIYVMPILAPAVPEKAARLRFFLSALHGVDEVSAAAETVAEIVAGL